MQVLQCEVPVRCCTGAGMHSPICRSIRDDGMAMQSHQHNAPSSAPQTPALPPGLPHGQLPVESAAGTDEVQRGARPASNRTLPNPTTRPITNKSPHAHPCAVRYDGLVLHLRDCVSLSSLRAEGCDVTVNIFPQQHSLHAQTVAPQQLRAATEDVNTIGPLGSDAPSPCPNNSVPTH